MKGHKSFFKLYHLRTFINETLKCLFLQLLLNIFYNLYKYYLNKNSYWQQVSYFYHMTFKN